jgi:hypothetical protein
MEVMGGGRFLMSEVPLYEAHPPQRPTRTLRLAPLPPFDGREGGMGSGDTTPCRMAGDTTPCRMTGVTLHRVVSPEGGGAERERDGGFAPAAGAGAAADAPNANPPAGGAAAACFGVSG